MEGLNENAVVQSDQIQTGEALGTMGAGVEADVDKKVADVTIEHPLSIISEIEHLLRIVGNVAVYEFRRITERLADLKNHPAIKPGE
ncbi:hypothetical protein [Burkholderia sp. LMG 13014]|uniref:hypothetical protein n=1 Tax=Burkholderia sp. LMG 13014 TaxID=2709306 RepID=UPI001963326F|nr:hypothetical protein [Burkholderia sp. LMG 13014]